MAKVLTQAASRALGVLISKYKSHGGLPFAVYSRLYDALMHPILDYGAAVWGTGEFSVISAIQHRVCKVFLGVGEEFCPNRHNTIRYVLDLPTPETVDSFT